MKLISSYDAYQAHSFFIATTIQEQRSASRSFVSLFFIHLYGMQCTLMCLKPLQVLAFNAYFYGAGNLHHNLHKRQISMPPLESLLGMLMKAMPF